MKKGHDFKDYICPDTFEFEKDHFRMGGKFGRVIFLRDYASYIKDSMVSELCDLFQHKFFRANHTVTTAVIDKKKIYIPSDKLKTDLSNRTYPLIPYIEERVKAKYLRIRN